MADEAEQDSGPQLHASCDDDIFKLAQNGDVQGVARLLESGTNIDVPTRHPTEPNEQERTRSSYQGGCRC